MGVKISEMGDNGVKFRENIKLVGDYLIKRTTKPWLYFDFMYSLLGYAKEVDKVSAPIFDFANSVIANRRREFVADQRFEQNDDEGKQKFAILDTLLLAQQEGLIDDEGICEETVTFIIAGSGTVEASVTFTLMLLAHHPEVQQKLYEEILGIVNKKETGYEFNFDDYHDLEYMDRVIKESLRIYPSVHTITRTLSESFTNGNLFLIIFSINFFILSQRECCIQKDLTCTLTFSILIVTLNSSPIPKNLILIVFFLRNVLSVILTQTCHFLLER